MIAYVSIALGVGIITTACTATAPVRQLTRDPKDHCLDNNENFSPDDQFLCYDTRPHGGSIANGKTIEKVDVKSGAITVLYEARDAVPDFGPGLAAVSYFPVGNEVVFICGKPPSTGLRYEKHRRFGRLVAIFVRPIPASDLRMLTAI